MTTERKIEPGPSDFIFDLYPRYSYDDRGRCTEDDRRADDLTSYGSSWNRTASGRYFVPEYLSFSDYSGCMVERANVNVFSETFEAGEAAWWFRAYGGHGTEAIVVDSHSIPEDVLTEVTEFLGGLADYPSADDELVSEMEMEGEGEAWESWARAAYIRALDLEEDTRDMLSDLDSAALREVFETVRERLNTYWECETGGGMWVDVQRIAAATDMNDIAALLPATE